MSTAEEILEEMENEANEATYIEIDSYLRQITIPEEIKILGVENDKEVRRLRFRMPAMYGEFNMADFDIRINYLNAQGIGDVYKVTDASAEGDWLTFSWLVGEFAAKYRGTVQFIVCAKTVNDEGEITREFNTTRASLPVLEGLEVNRELEERNPDLIEEILKRLDDLEEGGGAGGSSIDDTTASATTTYSSQKIEEELTQLSKKNVSQDEEIAKKANDSDLAAVAKSGKYEDLSGKPTIPTVPSALKNPYPLNINGQTYDGSEELTVTVEGGSGSGSDEWELINMVSTDEDVIEISVTVDTDGNAFSLKKALVVGVIFKPSGEEVAGAGTLGISFKSAIGPWGTHMYILGVTEDGGKRGFVFGAECISDRIQPTILSQAQNYGAAADTMLQGGGNQYRLNLETLLPSNEKNSPPIDGVRVGFYTGTPVGVGSQIRVYGVRT